jgi:hypothetical protein
MRPVLIGDVIVVARVVIVLPEEQWNSRIDQLLWRARRRLHLRDSQLG